MTIEVCVDDGAEYQCVWFVGNEFRRDRFKGVTIVGRFPFLEWVHRVICRVCGTV